MNPIYQQLNGNSNQYGNLIQRWNQFKAGFNGDARAQVQELLNSGKVTQQQYNQAQAMANQLRSILK